MCSVCNIEHTRQQRYGAKNYTNKLQAAQTDILKYGATGSIKMYNNTETCIKKRGVDNHVKVPSARDKVRATMMRKYRVDNAG